MCKRTINHKDAERFELVLKTQVPEIMALWLQDMYMKLGFISEAANLLILKVLRGNSFTELEASHCPISSSVEMHL